MNVYIYIYTMCVYIYSLHDTPPMYIPDVGSRAPRDLVYEYVYSHEYIYSYIACVYIQLINVDKASIALRPHI